MDKDIVRPVPVVPIVKRRALPRRVRAVPLRRSRGSRAMRDRRSTR